MTAAARRARSWTRSAWVLLTLVPFGTFGWGALLYAGVRARKTSWKVWAFVYFVAQFGGWVLSQLNEDEDAWTSDVGFGLVFGSWFATLVHALVIRSAYLERLDLFESGRFDEAEDRALERDEARRLALRDPARAVELGIGRPDLDDAFTGGLVDLNNAGPAAIETLPGVSRDLAERIVAVREEVDGFSSLEDAGHVLDLPAPLVDRIRHDVIVLPRGFER